jgi:hypothetical protein
MSRFVAIKTRLRDRKILQQCLEELHCQVLYQEQGIKMRGARTPVHLLVHAPFGTLGFRKTSSQDYELVADEHIIEPHKDFIQQLTQQYAYRKILKDAKAAGYNLVQEEVGEGNTIKLVVRKW